jgi:cyclophilin family peptidyl-prolyl cis-trans isomerase
MSGRHALPFAFSSFPSIMQQRFHARASVRSTGASALSALLLAALSGCGGGGDSTPATVATMSVAATKYGVPAQVTVTGTHLGNMSLTAPGCKNVTRLTAAPTASNDTTAYFSCTPSGAYTSTITAVTNGTSLDTATLTVQPPIVRMTVSGGGVNGNIDFALRGNQAPITVDNFLAYVNAGFYDGKDGKGATIFHRVVAGFVVQGGGYPVTTSGALPTPKTTTFSPINLETTGGSNLQWTAAMARTSDSNSATSQFFFNLANNSGTLDPSSKTAGYAVFADVSASASVIQAIAAAPCTLVTANGVPLGDGSCVPIPNVVVTSAAQIQ